MPTIAQVKMSSRFAAGDLAIIRSQLLRNRLETTMAAPSVKS
jgi:hypothetical protein